MATPFQKLIVAMGAISGTVGPARPDYTVSYIEPLPIPPKRIDLRRPRQSETAKKRKQEKRARRMKR